jgi:hypothetical protein
VTLNTPSLVLEEPQSAFCSRGPNSRILETSVIPEKKRPSINIFISGTASLVELPTSNCLLQLTGRHSISMVVKHHV